MVKRESRNKRSESRNEGFLPVAVCFKHADKISRLPVGVWLYTAVHEPMHKKTKKPIAGKSAAAFCNALWNKIYSLIFFTAFFSNKPLFFIFKEHIERSKRPVDAGNILLKIHLIFIAELFMRIDLLLQHP